MADVRLAANSTSALTVAGGSPALQAPLKHIATQCGPRAASSPDGCVSAFAAVRQSVSDGSFDVEAAAVWIAHAPSTACSAST